MQRWFVFEAALSSPTPSISVRLAANLQHIMIGTKVAHYVITSHLGTGGMGEVYQATDTKLERSVAIKFLSEGFSHDGERVARFQREARLLASLNQPNVAAIYGVEELNGRHFLIMELVPGDTLADRIGRGAIPLDEALPIAKQVAAAIEEAHEKGIVHRDLKPANIKITPDGTVKVLDFGLAKAYERESTDVSLSNSPTLSMGATNPGVIMGTAGYMAPEQARGKRVDKRADIWAFGVVFYEMLTGGQAFHGDDLTEILASVVMKDLDLGVVPPSVRRLLRKCLQKDPKKRLRDIGDVWDYMDEEEVAPQTPQPSRSIGGKLAYIVAAVALIAAVVAIWAPWRKLPPEPQLARFDIAPPETSTFDNALQLSPDGRQLAFVVRTGNMLQIWVRSMDTLKARPVVPRLQYPGPFWSPDNNSIVFQQDGHLKRVDIRGGQPKQLTDASSTSFGGGAESPVGTIVFGDRLGPLSKVSSLGGIAEPLTKLDEARGEYSHCFPSFLPDGKHFVYLRRATNVENTGIFIGSIDAKPEQQNSKVLIVTANSAIYTSAPDPRAATRGLGFLLFLSGDTLMSQPFDAEKLQLKGEPVPVAAGVASTNYAFGRFTASNSGSLAYIQSTASAGADTLLTWFGRDGKNLGTIGPPGNYQNLSISPDGSRVAAEKRDGAGGDIWLFDSTPGGKSDKFTFDSGIEETPIWSPDSKQVLYARGRDKLNMSLFLKPSNLAGDPVELFKASGYLFPNDWSRDGTIILSTAPQLLGNSFDIFSLAFDPAGKQKDLKLEPLIKTDQAEARGKLSPDGRWLAYESNATGRDEIYVRPFPPSPERTEQRKVSSGGGQMPLWNRNSKELFYKVPTGIVAVDVTLGNTLTLGQSKVLFVPPPSRNIGGGFNWDVYPDGSKFLMAVLPSTGVGSQPETITLVQNWTAGLK
jgi:serine/threonine protein kinase